MIADNQGAREKVLPEKSPDPTDAESSTPVLKPKKSIWRLLGDVLDHGGPGFLQFAITNICNARCDFCGFAVDKFDPSRRRSVSLEEARDVIDIAVKNHIGYLLFVGGEPLAHKDVPCPMCGGDDRFRFSDKGYGRWFCRGCGEGGDGVLLIARMKGITLAEALKLIESVTGASTRSIYKNDDRPKRDPLKPWRDASPLSTTGTVRTYLKTRGIELTEVEALSLRFHPALWHWPTASRWLAMVTCVKRADGTEITSHQTFLDLDGRGKAPFEKARLFAAGTAPEGGVWFGVANPELELIVAEGIESCLSAMRRYRVEAGVAALSEGGIRRLVLPENSAPGAHLCRPRRAQPGPRCRL